jgi:hypothetical protein
MDRRPTVPQPDVAALLVNYAISEAFLRADDSVRRYATRQFHAASTGISSSFT